jgi:uncharacterized membrane-anchored protein YitT (DUF2179 family)
MFQPAQTPTRHTFFEDAQALVTATLFIALGIGMYGHAGLLTGGTAGIAFLVHYATGWRFGPVFFAINLPFAWFAVRTLGWRFTIKSFIAVALLSVLTEVLPLAVRFDWLQPVYASIMGGFLIGVGLLMLFRHQASLGGVNVLVLWLQQRFGWRAGAVQMGIDCAIVVAALAIVDPVSVAISVIGAVALNLVVAINHKPGRYLGV